MALPNRSTSSILATFKIEENKEETKKSDEIKRDDRLSTLPKFLDKGSISELAEDNIFSFLTDTDLSNLAVNKTLAARTISDRRWVRKLKTPLFNGLYLSYLLEQIGNGNPIHLSQKSDVEDDEKEERKETETNAEIMVHKKVDTLMKSIMKDGIHNFQTIYARYKKLCFLSGKRYVLDADKLILLSSHNDSIKRWLETNRYKVLRNQSLGLEGRSAIFYLAISGNNEGLKLYQQLGFNVKCTHIAGKSIQEYVALSGNIQAIRICANEFKLNMAVVNKQGIGFQHLVVMSGSASALRACKNEFKLNMKALTKNGVGVQHLSASSGNPELIRISDKEFELPMKLLTKSKNSVSHFAALSGSVEAINLCVEMKLDMKLRNNDKEGVQHKAAYSGKYAALRACYEIGLDMKATADGVGLPHYAAQKGIETLRACRDIGLDMKSTTENDDGLGIHHILAQKGSAADLEFCSNELGINLSTPDKEGLTVVEHAAQHGNAVALRFFKKSGMDISKLNEELGVGVQHAAAFSGDPLTILTCAENGLEMKGAPGVRQDARLFVAKSDNPAALLIMQLLGAPITSGVYEEVKNSSDDCFKALAGILASCTPGMPYVDDCKNEWDKLTFPNVVDRVALFLHTMSKKPNHSIFSKGFYLFDSEREILQDLAFHLQTMRDANLTEVYVYLNYSFLNLVTTKKALFKYGTLDSFEACLCFASNQVLNAIHALKASKEQSKPLENSHGRRLSH